MGPEQIGILEADHRRLQLCLSVVGSLLSTSHLPAYLSVGYFSKISGLQCDTGPVSLSTASLSSCLPRDFYPRSVWTQSKSRPSACYDRRCHYRSSFIECEDEPYNGSRSAGITTVPQRNLQDPRRFLLAQREHNQSCRSITCMKCWMPSEIRDQGPKYVTTSTELLPRES